jgi:hypothetical protein
LVLRLERQPENADVFVLHRIESGGHFLQEPVRQFQIHLARGIQHFQVDAVLSRQPGDRFHIALGENSAHAGARLQAAGSNFLVQAERERQADGIGVHVFAEAGDFVDERNLGRHKSGGRFARQLRRFVIRDQYGNSAHDQRMKNLLQRGNGFARRRSRE